ncbi:MAG: FRG domain-containing protein [Myxococcales bacterium]
MNENAIVTVDCETAEELFEALRPRLPAPGRSKTIYRGCGDAAYKLIPKALRATAKDDPADMLILKEWALLCSFIEGCDLTGVRLPGDSARWRESLDQNTGALNRAAMHPSKWPDREHYEVWAMAQHHGLPTRLLDWSRSPIVAAYFAASSAMSERTSQGRLAVWSLPPDGEVFWREWLVTIAVPASDSVNLAAQQGLFSLTLLPGVRGRPLAIEAFEEIAARIFSGDATLLRKHTLPRDEAPELLELCEAYGVSGATMFPGSDGAARFALEKHARFDEQESRNR